MSREEVAEAIQQLLVAQAKTLRRELTQRDQPNTQYEIKECASYLSCCSVRRAKASMFSQQARSFIRMLIVWNVLVTLGIVVGLPDSVNCTNSSGRSRPNQHEGSVCRREGQFWWNSI